MKYLPSDIGDRIGIIVTLCLIISVTVNSLFSIYRRSLEEGFNSIFFTLAGMFIGLNALGNLYKSVVVDTTIDSIDLPTVLLPEWRYCSYCEQNAPPRCFHCFTCNKCVLKRHNHCMFLGKCAGYKNHRYYLMFIVYVWLGVTISNVINSDYILDIFYYDFSLQKFFIGIMPLFAILLGMIHPFDFFYIFLNSITIILCPLIFMYMLLNFKMASSGQTWHENAKNITIYNMGFFNNLRECFGLNWIQATLNPLSKLKLEGDGTRFKTNGQPIKPQPNFNLNSHDNMIYRRRENNLNYNY